MTPIEKLVEYRRLRALAVGRRRQVTDVIGFRRKGLGDEAFEAAVELYVRARDAAISARHAALGAAS